MFTDVVRFIAENGIERVYPVLILTILRPLGLLFGFIAMRWAFGPARVLRISIAAALGIPVMAGNVAAFEPLILEANIGTLALIAPLEFGVGYAIGFLSSLPLFALQFAGAITDSVRGESDSGLTTPAGEPVSTFGALYLVIGIAAFAMLDGIAILAGSLYQSYSIWPIGNMLPALSMDAAGVALDILGSTLLLAIQIATPLLIFLVAIEFIVSIAARVARRFNFYDHAFAFRNLAAVLSLPLLASFVWLLASGLMDDIGAGLLRLEAFFQ